MKQLCVLLVIGWTLNAALLAQEISPVITAQNAGQIVELTVLEAAKNISMEFATDLSGESIYFQGSVINSVKGEAVPLKDFLTLSRVLFSPDGTALAGRDEEVAGVWDAQTGDFRFWLRGHEQAIDALAFSPDGKLLATGSSDRTIRLWDVESGQQLRLFASDRVEYLAFSADGKYLASMENDGSRSSFVRVRAASDGEVIFDVRYGVGRQTNYEHPFTHDLRRFVVYPAGSIDLTVQVWSVEGELLISIPDAHTSTIQGAGFSPDGTRLLTYTNKVAHVWDAETGELIATIQDSTPPITGRVGSVEDVAFSPDGSLIATASIDGTVRVWDASTGALAALLTGHTNWVKRVSFTADGTRLVSAAYDNTVRVWGLP